MRPAILGLGALLLAGLSHGQNGFRSTSALPGVADGTRISVQGERFFERVEGVYSGGRFAKGMIVYGTYQRNGKEMAVGCSWGEYRVPARGIILRCADEERRIATEALSARLSRDYRR